MKQTPFILYNDYSLKCLQHLSPTAPRFAVSISFDNRPNALRSKDPKALG